MSSDAERLSAAVLKAASSGGSAPLSVLSTTSVRHPDTGAELTAAVVVDAAQPNAAAQFVVVDDDGEPVNLGELRRAGLDPFAPPEYRVSAATTSGHTVTIDPPRDDLTLSECDIVSEKITVMVPPSGVVSRADVYFLADTTGSMEPVLSAVRSGASTILSALLGLGIDIAFGVGNYRDFPSDPAPFHHQLSPTAAPGAVQGAVNAWTAAGGGDIPEAGFFALDALAQPSGGSIGWRPDSTRIVVWFGDAPAHDPVCVAVSGLATDITEASVTAKLVAEKLAVLAISTTTGTPGALDADPRADSVDYGGCGAPGGAPGQATRIAAATGGAHATGIDPDTVVKTVIDLVRAAIGSIKNVRLVASGEIVPFVTSIEPAAGYGPLRGDSEHTLEFAVTFTGGAVDCERRRQVFTGSLDVVADGAVVARKPTVVTVPACSYAYAVKFVCGDQGGGCGCRCAAVQPGRYSTEVNVRNSRCQPATVTLRVNPLMMAGAAVGRFPNVVAAKPFATLTLRQGEATMLDCCVITGFLLGADPAGSTPTSIGFVELSSDQELDVTAVYTANGPDGSGPALTVLHVDPAAL
jgi:hypothetical protein